MFKLFQSKKTKILIVTIFRLCLGSFFIAFGFLRAVNPIGGSYKLEYYMSAIGLDFFIPLSLIIAIIGSAIEFGLGISLIMGTGIKKTALYSTLFLFLLTSLNFYTAYFEPIKRSDAFGDIIWVNDNISCWFYLLFLIIAISIYGENKFSFSPFTKRTQWLVKLCSFIFPILISAYSYIQLPFLDLGPYRIGTNLKGYEIKDTLKRYEPAADSSIFRLSHKIKVKTPKGGTTSAIQLYDKFEGDVTHEILDKKGYTFLLIAENLKETSTSKRHIINSLYDYAQKNDYGFYCLTSSRVDSNIAEEYIVESFGSDYLLINTDQQILRTMINSNPGLILLKDGVIYQKWSNNEIKTFDKPLNQIKEGSLTIPSMHKRITYAILFFGTILISILALDWLIGLAIWGWKKILKKKNKKATT